MKWLRDRLYVFFWSNSIMPSAAACPVAYCVKCKKKQQMGSCKKATSSNGRNMMKGVCKKCGTNMNIFTK